MSYCIGCRNGIDKSDSAEAVRWAMSSIEWKLRKMSLLFCLQCRNIVSPQMHQLMPVHKIPMRQNREKKSMSSSICAPGTPELHPIYSCTRTRPMNEQVATLQLQIHKHCNTNEAEKKKWITQRQQSIAWNCHPIQMFHSGECFIHACVLQNRTASCCIVPAVTVLYFVAFATTRVDKIARGMFVFAASSIA